MNLLATTQEHAFVAAFVIGTVLVVASAIILASQFPKPPDAPDDF